jgi:hypothetical protein
MFNFQKLKMYSVMMQVKIWNTMKIFMCNKQHIYFFKNNAISLTLVCIFFNNFTVSDYGIQSCEW